MLIRRRRQRQIGTNNSSLVLLPRVRFFPVVVVAALLVLFLLLDVASAANCRGCVATGCLFCQSLELWQIDNVCYCTGVTTPSENVTDTTGNSTNTTNSTNSTNVSPSQTPSTSLPLSCDYGWGSSTRALTSTWDCANFTTAGDEAVVAFADPTCQTCVATRGCKFCKGTTTASDNERIVPDLCLCADNTSDYEATCDSIAPNTQEFDSQWDCRFDTADGEGALEFRVTSAILATIVAIGLACWGIHRKQCAAASAQSSDPFVDRQRRPEQATEIHGRLRQPPPRQIYWVEDADLCHEFYSTTATSRPAQATTITTITTNSDAGSSNVVVRNSQTNGTIAILPQQAQLPIPPPTRIYWVEDDLRGEFDLANTNCPSLSSSSRRRDGMSAEQPNDGVVPST